MSYAQAIDAGPLLVQKSASLQGSSIRLSQTARMQCGPWTAASSLGLSLLAEAWSGAGQELEARHHLTEEKFSNLQVT